MNGFLYKSKCKRSFDNLWFDKKKLWFSDDSHYVSRNDLYRLNFDLIDDWYIEPNSGQRRWVLVLHKIDKRQ